MLQFIKSEYYFFSIAFVILFSVIWVRANRWFNRIAKVQNDPVTYDSATKAIERMGNFTSWLTGLQTAAMAAMGLLIKDRVPDCTVKAYGFFAILFFGASVILSAWVLAALPSIQGRLVKQVNDNPTTANDIYELPLFSFVRIKLASFSGLLHMFFLIGIVFFALFVLKCFSLPPLKTGC
jgi:hypothetical protein